MRYSFWSLIGVLLCLYLSACLPAHGQTGRQLDLSRYPADNLILQQAIATALARGEAEAAWQMARQHLDFLYASPASLALSAEAARQAGFAGVADQIVREARRLWPADVALLQMALDRLAQKQACVQLRGLLGTDAAARLPAARQDPASYGCQPGWHSRQHLSVHLQRSRSGINPSSPVSSFRPATGSRLDRFCSQNQPLCPADRRFRLDQAAPVYFASVKLGIEMARDRSKRPQRDARLIWQTDRAKQAGLTVHRLRLQTGFGFGRRPGNRFWLRPYLAMQQQPGGPGQPGQFRQQLGLVLSRNTQFSPTASGGMILDLAGETGQRAKSSLRRGQLQFWLAKSIATDWLLGLDQTSSWQRPAVSSLYGPSVASQTSLSVGHQLTARDKLHLRAGRRREIFDRPLPWLAVPHQTDSLILDMVWQSSRLGRLGVAEIRISRLRHRSSDPLSDYADMQFSLGFSRDF